MFLKEAQCSRGLQKTFNQKEVILPTCNLCDVVLIGLDIGICLFLTPTFHYLYFNF